MKKILFLIFVFSFPQCLSSSDLTCQIDNAIPPQSDMGVPWPVEHDFELNPNNNEITDRDKKNDGQSGKTTKTINRENIRLRRIIFEWF